MATRSLSTSLISVTNQVQRGQEAELARAAAAQAVRVTTQSTTGTGDIDATFSLDTTFRLVFVRAHFSGTSGVNALQISLDSALGAAYDTVLHTVKVAGTGADVNFRLSAWETVLPSAWAVEKQDKFRIRWINPGPGKMVWGLEVGLALA